ncbi:MAG: immunity 22 family protein [Lachnospiraceae bacterium]|nr:immunity 22 family protein [Lachnospiraceae bacterium]
MIKENKVSLWLGYFKTQEEFSDYLNISYDEDGNLRESQFQKDFSTGKYDLDGIETAWGTESCTDVQMLLEGFSGDEEIIPQFEKLIVKEELKKYNSIVLLYNYEYSGIEEKNGLRFIGTADVTSIM